MRSAQRFVPAADGGRIPPAEGGNGRLVDLGAQFRDIQSPGGDQSGVSFAASIAVNLPTAPANTMAVAQPVRQTFVCAGPVFLRPRPGPAHGQH